MLEHERETYRLHAGLRSHQRKIDRSHDIVRGALCDVAGAWGIGVSGGKDSVVLAHLAVQAGWRGPLFHYWSDEIPEENSALVVALGGQLGCPVICERITGDFDLFAALGRLLIVAESAEDRAIIRAHDRRYRAEIESHVQRHGLAGLFWGLRREESRARAITISRNGTLYRARNRQEWTCHPLAYWSSRDVWAYLVRHDLPWLSVYDRADDRERERSETTFQFGLSGGLWAQGQGARLRESDPALWARLCARFPDLRRWG